MPKDDDVTLEDIFTALPYPDQSLTYLLVMNVLTTRTVATMVRLNCPFEKVEKADSLSLAFEKFK